LRMLHFFFEKRCKSQKMPEKTTKNIQIE